jgi:cytochrome oxidase Cu insertion factor (SCO1/SenC/PrrC family)
MNRRSLVIAGLALALSAAAGAYYYRNLREIPGGQTLGGPFSLTDPDGRRVGSADFSGKWLIIYFGFTYCPDACPTALNTMSLLLDRLGPAAAEIQPIFHHRRSRARFASDPQGLSRLVRPKDRRLDRHAF